MRTPGLYPGIPEAEYHADDALCQSGAKLLIDAPARYQWDRQHPREATDAMDHGSIVHALALGQPDVHVLVDADSWRTTAARKARDDARKAGLIPVLPDQFAEAQAMADALRNHPYVGAVLAADGDNEVSMWWQDERTGIGCRGRIDAIRMDADGTPVLVDIKTARNVAPWPFGKAAADLGYHMQAWAYLAGYRALTGQDATFILVAAESTEPYYVAPYTFTSLQLDAGRARWETALDIYAECAATDTWSAYHTEPITLDMPAWAL